jgi:hypothetical protein
MMSEVIQVTPATMDCHYDLTFLDSDDSENNSINRTRAGTIRKCQIHLDLIPKTNFHASQ